MRRHQVRDTNGFTLVEMLVAVAILGLLLSAIVALTSGFLGFSRHVSIVNERLADLNDAMGYIALNARRAVTVIGDSTVMTIVPSEGGSFTCSVAPTNPNPCIALVVPVTNTTSGAIAGYNLLAYRVAPFSAWGGNPGLVGGWNGNNTPTLFEYSMSLCTSCAIPTVAGTTRNTTRTSLVMTDLFLEDAAGAPFPPFAILATNSRVAIALRTRGSGLSDDIRVPSDGPLRIMALLRP